MATTVTDVPERERFEARDEAGDRVGTLTYQVSGGIVVYTHTEPGPDPEALFRAAMQDAKARGRTVVPMCPLLSGWLDDHHEYDKLVARTTRRVK